jgi:hypothetical protein
MVGVFVVLGLLLAACGGPADPGIDITLESLENGQVVSSNVLVRGSFPVGITVASLAFKVNSDAEVDVTATIDGRTFVFTISGGLFVVGPNVIRIILTEVGGRTTTKVVNVTFDPTVAPPTGSDVVVFNDINIFDQTAMVDPNNVRFVQNLVSFASGGPRDSGTVVWFDRGRGSHCFATSFCRDADLATAVTTIEAEGLSVAELNSTGGSITSIPANVKSVFFWTPLVAFTLQEINALKSFAAEGGRIVFIGEHDGYYPANGLALQNQFLEDMGAVMRNTGGAIDCEYTVLPAASLRPGPLTEGLEQLTIACASVIELGPNDFALFYDTSNASVLAGVAAIDVTPLAVAAEPAAFPALAPSGAPERSPSGL